MFKNYYFTKSRLLKNITTYFAYRLDPIWQLSIKKYYYSTHMLSSLSQQRSVVDLPHLPAFLATAQWQRSSDSSNNCWHKICCCMHHTNSPFTYKGIIYLRSNACWTRWLSYRTLCVSFHIIHHTNKGQVF